MTATLSNETLLAAAFRDRVRSLRTELAELAFELERRGRLDAADAVNAIVPRLAEIENWAATTVAQQESTP